MNELMNLEPTQVTFVNEDLTKATERILKVGNKIKKNLYEIAYVLAKVDEKKMYEEDGFKNTAEYAMKTFNFKKTMAYSLIKVGKEYTTAQLESNLPHEKGEDFSVTQVEKMLPLKDREKVVELIEAEEITPEMSAKEISQVIKSKLPHKKSKAKEEDTADTADTANTDSGQPENEVSELQTVYMNMIQAINEFSNLTNKKAHMDKLTEITFELNKIKTELE